MIFYPRPSILIAFCRLFVASGLLDVVSAPQLTIKLQMLAQLRRIREQNREESEITEAEILSHNISWASFLRRAFPAVTAHEPGEQSRWRNFGSRWVASRSIRLTLPSTTAVSPQWHTNGDPYNDPQRLKSGSHNGIP